jgi:nucleoside 2-deoxyribosyltransferase
VYLAGPLFSDAERTFNEWLCEQVEQWMDVYLPQRDGGLVSEMVCDGVSPDVATRKVFEGDVDAICRADCLVAILDGRAIDEGVAFEIGVAYCYAKRCIGLQTDCRRLAPWGNNPMITGALELIFESVADLTAWVEGEARKAENHYLPAASHRFESLPLQSSGTKHSSLSVATLSKHDPVAEDLHEARLP